MLADIGHILSMLVHARPGAFRGDGPGPRRPRADSGIAQPHARDARPYLRRLFQCAPHAFTAVHILAPPSHPGAKIC
ncbi:hypothetical protein GCM10010329_53490 [Streptomyces spiroverticillatus]|nr:hypothetical protein GCM10010329_53490 [Streptomyces spiroverticillatus]